MLKRLFLILLALSLVGTMPSVRASDPLEYQLAKINAGRPVPKDHVTVARFRSLLNQLSATFVEDRQQIADMSVGAQKMLREKGIQESLINIMEGMNQLFSRRVENQEYAQYVAFYVLNRNKGWSHSDAIQGLQEILRGLGVR